LTNRRSSIVSFLSLETTTSPINRCKTNWGIVRVPEIKTRQHQQQQHDAETEEEQEEEQRFVEELMKNESLAALLKPIPYESWN